MADLLGRLHEALAPQYRIERELGAGGMAVVFLAEDLRHRRRVALKVLRPELAAEIGPGRFLREIETAARLTHPHILPIHDSGEASGLLYYVMPYVEGESLRGRLAREKQLPVDDALRIAREVADALSYAHSHGVVHRDIKPENILLQSGHAVVSDFGIARAITAAAGDARTATLTAAGTSLGTPGYMSPEQVAGSRDVDGRSDLYSLGCMLYEMLAGQPPFTGPTVESLLHQHLTAEAPSITVIRPAVPGWVASAIQRALAKTPADRFSPVALFAEALAPRESAAVVATPAAAPALQSRLRRELESGASRSYGEIKKARTPRRGRAWVVTVAAVLAIGLAAWLVGRMVRPWTTRTADARTVLILPLEVRGQAEGAGYVGRALAEAIAVNLAQSKNLTVLPVPERGEAGQGRIQSRLRAALASGAGRLLTGAVVRDAKGLHASVSLLDSERNRIVWGTQKSTEADDLPGLAASMARELSTELGAETPKLYDTPLHTPVPPQMAASPDLIEYRAAIRRFDYSASLAASKRLVKSFPGEPLALAFHLIPLFQYASESGPSSPQRLEFETGAAALARVDPNNPLVEQLRALLLSFDGRDREAVQLFTKILSRTDLAPAERAMNLMGRGQSHSLRKETDLALADLEEALQLDPANDLNFAFASGILRFLNRNEESLTFARNAMALNPESYQNNWGLGDTLYRLRRWEEAVPPLRKACGINATQWVCAFYALALLRAGHKTEAKAAVQRAAALPEHYIGSYYLACYHAVSGDRRQAIRLLRRAYEGASRQGGGSLDDYEDLRNEFDLLPLHGDPEFEKILSEVKERGPYK